MSDLFDVQLQDGSVKGKKLSSAYHFDQGDYMPGNESFIGGLTTPSVKKRRIYLLFFFVFLVIAILISRIFWLQVVGGEEYRDIAEGNRIRLVPVKADRGLIYDRNLQPLVKNIPSFSLSVIPGDLPSLTTFTQDIIVKHPLLTEYKDLISDKIPRTGVIGSYQPVVIKENLDHSLAMNLMLELNELPGIVLEIKAQRQYLSGEEAELFSHILGYTGKISPEELQKQPDYLITDSIGKTGLELYYETLLKGKDGQKRIEVNSLGKEEGIVSQQSAKTGQDLILSLDFNLQKKAAEVLTKYIKLNGSQTGTVIALNPQTGEILSIFSFPAYDNNIFIQGSSEDYQALLKDSDRPLFFRAISGEYTPGSVIKPVIAAGALIEDIINGTTTILSQGGIRINQWFFADWKEGGHGRTDLIKALAESINTFFYYLGGGYGDFEGLGIEKINYYARLFGLTQKTGIDLPGESQGFLATPQWKQETKKEPWYIGDTYHISIGQGDILVTPLQVANYTAAIANQGTFFRPHLVKQIRNAETGQKREITPEVIRQNFINLEQINLIRRGLRAAVTDGSARKLADLSIEVAGKTGTAQVGGDKNPHAWFTGFAPYKNPEIVLTVLIENGGEGSAAAVPAAKEILQWWIEQRGL